MELTEKKKEKNNSLEWQKYTLKWSNSKMKHTSKKVIMADEWWFHRPISVWWSTCRNKEKEEVIVFKRNNVFFFVVIKCMKKYCERIIQNGIERDKIAKLFCTHTIFIKNPLQLLWLAIIFIIICSALEIGKWVDVWLVVCTQVFCCCCFMFVVVVSGLVDVAATPGIYGFMRDNQQSLRLCSLARSLNFFDGLQNELERPRFPLRSTNMLNDDQWCEIMVCVRVVLQPPRLCKILHLLFCTRGINFDMGQ